jgi:hypothetical protein
VRLRPLTRLLVALVVTLVLVVPSVAGGARKPRPTDGTLSVRRGKGVVQIAARGTIIGRIDQGQVLVIDRNPFDASVPVVRGGRLRQLTNRRIMRQGKSIRFRLANGFYRLRVQGRGIEISAVGRGSVTLNGDERYADTGTYSLNGAEFLPVPYDADSMQLVAGPPPPTGQAGR